MLILHGAVSIFYRLFYVSFENTTPRETQHYDFDRKFTAISTEHGIGHEIEHEIGHEIEHRTGRICEFLPLSSPCVRSYSLENPQSKACGNNRKAPGVLE